MKNRAGLVFILTALVCACFAACSNPIMESWWFDSDGGRRAVSPAYHVVTFVENGGEPIQENQLIAHNEKIAKLHAMTRGGFGFGGWFMDEAFTREWNFASDTVTSDLTLYAKWSSQTFHKVTFDTEGGNPSVAPIYILEGARIPEPPALRQAITPGSNIWKSFGGWYTDPGFTRQWNFAADTMSTSDITLYARWENPHFLVTFEAGGGTPDPRPQDIFGGTKLVEPYAMNKSGHGFGGWYTDVAFTRQWDFAAGVVSGNMTLYARWVTDWYTITFFPNGGSPAPRSQSVAYRTTVTKPPVMRNPDKAFIGWFTNEGFTNEWDFDTPVAGDINLYAKWVDAHFTVSFNLKLPVDIGLPSSPSTGHGNTPAPQDLISGGKVTEPPTPVNIPGYSFFGWYSSGSPGPDSSVWNTAQLNSLTEWDFGSPVYSNRTLYARWIKNNITDMVWVQGGSFIMGGGTGASPAHNVTIARGFYINKYPVTQQEYQSIMTGESGANANPSQFQASQVARPVERVSWYDAIQYCIRLTSPGLTQVYTISSIVRQTASPPPTSVAGSIYSADVAVDWNGTGYRLPTEAEWEYAARGGNGSPGNYIYAGSDNADDVAWYNTNSSSMTHPVGTRAPNGLGIYDMNGNVSEWCWDWYGSRYYSESNSTVDPRGPLSGTERVRRGGSWNNALNNVRNVVRDSELPEHANWVIGFRVVRGYTASDLY